MRPTMSQALACSNLGTYLVLVLRGTLIPFCTLCIEYCQGFYGSHYERFPVC